MTGTPTKLHNPLLTWHHSLDEYIYGLLQKLWKCLLPEPFSSSNTFVFFQCGARRNCRTIPTLVRMWRDFRRCFSGGVCGHPFLNWADLDKHSPVHKKVLLYLNLYIHALSIYYIKRYRHIDISYILYIMNIFGKSYFRLSQHRFDNIHFLVVIVVAQNLNSHDMMPKTHHLPGWHVRRPKCKFQRGKNAALSGKTTWESSQIIGLYSDTLCKWDCLHM